MRMLSLALLGFLSLGLLAGDVHAGRPSGRPSFSGGSSGRKSFTSGVSGRSSFAGSRQSFSGGSSTTDKPKPKPTQPSKPAFSGGSSSTPTKPAFSGGSSSSSTTKPAFSGGTTVTTRPIEGRTPVHVEKKPIAPKWDALAGNDMKKVESRKAYERSTAPAPSFKTPGGKEIKIDPKDKKIEYLRGRLDQTKWENRQLRTDNFYHNYNARPLIVYHDCYHPYWNYYLMSRPLDDVAMWIYCNQVIMMQQDRARLDWYYSQNPDLRIRVAALEARGVARNPNYVPPGVDPDMPYNDGYVNAAFNPTPRTTTHYHYADDGGSGMILLWIFVFVPGMILCLWLLIWLVFIRRTTDN